MDYYNEIRNELIDNEINKRVKDYSKNKYELEKYYNVGKLLSEAGKHYGEGIIKEYSKRLTNELGKGYSKRNLWMMLRFYILKEKMQTLSAQLSWSHYCELIWIDDINIINYYINVSINQNLSVRQLREIIKSKEYERLPEKTKIKFKNNEVLNIVDEIKDPIIINNKIGLDVDSIKENILEKIVLEDLNNFLNQLGSGFCYIQNQYKIRIGNTYNYIDMLLYNVIYHSYVVVELKVTELKKEHIGQVMVYMNYIDNNIKEITDNKTIGLIVVKKNNNYIIKYSSDKRIIAREYELV